MGRYPIPRQKRCRRVQLTLILIFLSLFAFACRSPPAEPPVPFSSISGSMPTPYACPAVGCSARFSARRGLNIHEASCSYFRAEEERKQVRRAARAKAEEDAIQEKRRRLVEKVCSSGLARYPYSTTSKVDIALLDTSVPPRDVSMTIGTVEGVSMSDADEPAQNELIADTPSPLNHPPPSAPSVGTTRTSGRRHRRHRRPARCQDAAVELPRSAPMLQTSPHAPTYLPNCAPPANPPLLLGAQVVYCHASVYLYVILSRRP